VDGTVHVSFTNGSRRTLEEAIFILFPNRFTFPDEGVNDFNRAYVYPEKDFDPGWMEILDARDAGRLVPVERVRHPNLPDGTVVRVRIARLLSGQTRTITLRFRTFVPYRFGTFGVFEDQLTLVGGWYPYLAPLDDEGTWRVEEPPPLADFDVHLRVPTGLELLLNGQHFERGQRFVAATVSEVRYLSLIAAPVLIREETHVDGTRVMFFRRPSHLAQRISLEPPPSEIMLSTLRDVLRQRPAAVPAPPAEVVVIEAPLRLNLTAPGEGALIVSDRALKTLWLIRSFHELQLAQGLYGELLRPVLSAREPNADAEWVEEGLSRVLAQRFVAQAHPDTRSVYDWIDLFNIFAIVDRFETEPKIPFVSAFFDRARVADPLHAEIMTFNDTLPPGRIILAKLRELIGAPLFDAAIDQCATGAVFFRRCMAEASGQDLDRFFEQWLGPYPSLNYRFDAVELDQPTPGGFRSTATVRRDSSRQVAEPITIRMRSVGGQDVDVRWNGDGDTGQVSVETSQPVWQAQIDPERKLVEDRRDDNASPFAPQIVLDTAEVEVSSTEFGISALVVGRNRYDYQKDLAFAAFYTNRSAGVTSGGRWHWGTSIDPTLYPHNVYLFYGFQWLDGSFKDKSHPTRRTRGQSAALGFRYDYSNVFAFDSPSAQRNLRLYADWFDGALGSDFDYVDWGISVSVTQPLWSHRTVAAAQLLNGFSEPLGNSEVPNQGRYSLGGSRSIRGIGAEEELGRNIFLVRAELRQDIYPEVDLNLFDLFVLRRSQMRVFADSGRVDDAAGRVYDVGHYAVGIGVGFAAVYDFMGFFPAVAYLEVATRVDKADQIDNVQVLFGTRQAF